MGKLSADLTALFVRREFVHRGSTNQYPDDLFHRAEHGDDIHPSKRVETAIEASGDEEKERHHVESFVGWHMKRLVGFRPLIA